MKPTNLRHQHPKSGKNCQLFWGNQLVLARMRYSTPKIAIKINHQILRNRIFQSAGFCIFSLFRYQNQFVWGLQTHQGVFDGATGFAASS